MENIRVIYSKDLIDAEIKSFMERINSNNDYLYKHLSKWLNKENSPGIRYDVLKYVSENIESIPKDNQFAFYLADLFGNTQMGPDYYSWISDYYSDEHPAIDIQDFMIILIDAVEKNIPLSDIKIFFAEGKDDFMAVYQKVDHYTNPVSIESDVETIDSNHSIISSTTETLKPDQKRDDNMVSVFGDLLTVMTAGKKEEENSILPIQQTFTKMIAQLQLDVNEITGFSTHVIHEWETDKEKIIRLEALYNIQQRMLMSQQQKLYEARSEIDRLNKQLQDAEKMKLHNKTINQKAEELQKLLSQQSGGMFLDD